MTDPRLLEKREILRASHEATPGQVERVLLRERLTPADLPVLLSPAADHFLEEMAARAHKLTLEKFGRTIQLYIPLYLSNECTNACLYCGFNVNHTFHRKTSTLPEIQEQLRVIGKMEFRHLLLLSGEAPQAVPVDFISQCVQLAKPDFPSVSLEVYPMEIDGYRRVVEAGAEGLIVYQETYDSEVYARVHPRGPKRNYLFRLEAPERAAQADFRKIGLGALLGLSEHVFDLTALAHHLALLKKRYWRVFFTVSFPRLRPALGGFETPHPVNDKELVKAIVAMRLLFDDLGIIISTREPAELRDHLLPLGVTQMSAGSRTNPCGYLSLEGELKQFEVEDRRTPPEVVQAIIRRGYDPVWKDWDPQMG